MAKKLVGFLLVLLVLIFAIVVGCENAATTVESVDQAVSVPETGTPIEGSYVVVFKDQSIINSDASFSKAQEEMQMLAAEVLADNNISTNAVSMVYSSALAGFAAKISADEADVLREDPRIGYIEQDMVINGGPRWRWDDDDDPEPETQTIPWGITRVGGAVTYTGSHVAWIIDTGVDIDHPDLNVDASRGATFIDNTTTPDDDNGHGSHVAGTIAAIDNDIFVVGVAAGATVVPVKVLDSRGSGTTTGVIAGVDFVASHGTAGDVANMSLGGGISDALDAAVLNASNKGIYFALAAGNESQDANNSSPGRVNGTYIYTVSAFDSNDYWASFSNYGNPPIDFAGPGVSILSLYKSGGSATLSGTSMATPHICGLLLSTSGNVHTDGYVNGDPDGNPDPIAHR